MENSNKKIIFNTLAFVFGVFLLAMTYNIFLLPNNLVVGGMSGLSVIFQKIFNWNGPAFIYVSSFILLIVSYIFLGKDVTFNTAIGSILYPVMITLTSPIANVVLHFFDVNEYVIIVALASLGYGLACGIIYKTGYTTGGGDVIMQLLSKYLNITTSKANFTYSFIIIFLSGCVFGIASFIYACMLLVISNFIINKIVIGVSNSKVFYIVTHEPDKVKKLIKEEYHSGYTVIKTKSDITKKNGELIMVVVTSRYYHVFKNEVLDIDSDAFITINDCYEVKGGLRKKFIPYF